jgi:hypothetical protein
VNDEWGLVSRRVTSGNGHEKNNVCRTSVLLLLEVSENKSNIVVRQ